MSTNLYFTYLNSPLKGCIEIPRHYIVDLELSILFPFIRVGEDLIIVEFNITVIP